MFELLGKYLGPYRGKTIIGALSKVVEVIVQEHRGEDREEH